MLSKDIFLLSYVFFRTKNVGIPFHAAIGYVICQSSITVGFTGVNGWYRHFSSYDWDIS